MQTIHDYFQRAFQRRVDSFHGVPGEACIDDEGNSVRFWLHVDNGRIVDIQFQCTTCCTLVALCEHARDLLKHATLQDAAGCTGRRFLILHPEIPAMRHHRATLVAEAIRSAAARANTENYS